MSWMIKIWMKKHLVSDSNGNNIDLLSQKIYKEWHIMLGQHLVFGGTRPWITNSIK